MSSSYSDNIIVRRKKGSVQKNDASAPQGNTPNVPAKKQKSNPPKETVQKNTANASSKERSVTPSISTNCNLSL